MRHLVIFRPILLAVCKGLINFAVDRQKPMRCCYKLYITPEVTVSRYYEEGYEAGYYDNKDSDE